MEPTKTQEEYLKTIYSLRRENGKARVTDIAKKLNKTKTSGYINYETYGEISLTKKRRKNCKKNIRSL